MKAVRFHEHGGPEVLRFEDAPDPVAAPGRAIVRVRACALNHLDLWERRGLDRVKLPLPHISGSDVAGELLDFSAGPSTPPSIELTPGQRVMLQPGLRCGRCPACREGRDNQCIEYDVLGLRSDGGYAELISVPIENLMPIPAHVDFVTAAAFP
jgi:NADPH:quinone reductase-like Zn-dependent oxidoreductase